MAKTKTPQDSTRQSTNKKLANLHRRVKRLEKFVAKITKKSPSIRGGDDDNIVWGT